MTYKERDVFEIKKENGMFELPPLPYKQDALQPYLSKETLEFHWGKHHKAYVDNLNKLIPNTKFSELALEKIIKTSDGPIFNNSAQIWNHTFYWHCLTPKSAKEPTGKLADAIKKKFGSFDDFKKSFTESGTKLFGSGWTWLAKNNAGEIEILNTNNADLPMKQDKKALLTC